MMAPVRDTETLCSVDFTDYTWPEDELASLAACIASRPACEPSAGLDGSSRKHYAIGQEAPAAPAAPEIGHNKPPRLEDTDLAEQIEAIVDSTYTGPQKLVLIKIRLRSDHGTLKGAFPSYATLSRAASVKDPRTVKEAVELLVDEDEEGKSA